MFRSGAVQKPPLSKTPVLESCIRLKFPYQTGLINLINLTNLINLINLTNLTNLNILPVFLLFHFLIPAW